MRGFTAALLGAALFGTPGPAAAEVRRYAVVVGFNGAGDLDRPTLRFADDDAARIHEILARVSHESRLLTRLDEASQQTFGHLVPVVEPPTRAHLLRVLGELEHKVAADAAAGRRVEVWFFYAGHGDTDQGRGYVVLADGRFTRDDLRTSLLSEGRADRVHVLVDACKAYYLVAGRGPGGERAPHPGGFAGPEVTDGVGYVLSTSNDAESHEWAVLQGGVFSHEIRSALLGAADLDGDGTVAYEELQAFVAVANEGVMDARFRPQVYIRPPGGHLEMPFFTPAHLVGATRLSLAEGAGRVSITDARGLRQLDVFKGEGLALALHVPGPGRHLVRFGDDRRVLMADGTSNRFHDLPRDETEESAARGEGHQAFQTLFSRALEPAVLRGLRLGRTLAEPPVAAAESNPERWAPALGGAGLVAAGGGVALHLLALDRFHQADTGPQVDRTEHEARGTAFAYSAGMAYVVAAGALGTALWLWLDE